MADRDLKIEVHYEDHGAQQAVQKLDASLEGVGTTATQASQGGLTKMSGLMKGALVGAATAAAYQASELVAELVDMADGIQRVSDRTGLTIRAVQQLGFAASQSGNTIDQITAALGQMQNRLASGDKSAVAAVQALGLNLEQLLALQPDEQFYALAKAVGEIPDPMIRTQLAMDLFGRTGAAILPTLIADIEKLRDAAPVLSDRTVTALDRMGDAWDRLKLKSKVAVAEAVMGLADYAGAFVNAGMGGVVAQAAAGQLGQAGHDIKLVGDTFKTDYTENVVAATKATKAFAGAVAVTKEPLWSLADALKALRVNADAAGPEIGQLDGQLVGLGQTAQQVLPWLGWAGETNTGLLPSTDVFAGTILGLEGVTDALTTTGAAATVTGATTHTGLSQATSAMDTLSRVAEMSGHRTTAALLSAASATATAFATGGPWAAAITGAISLVSTFANALAGLFGGGKEWNDVKTARSAFEAQFGGYEGFMQAIGSAFTAGGQSNAAAEAAILAFWNAKDMNALMAAMQVLKDALEGHFGGASGGGSWAPGSGLAPPLDDVPSFASGGVIDAGRGTLAMLHGREAIVPLDRPGRVGVGGAPISVVINNPEIDNSVGLDRFTRRLELALDRAARRARA